MPGDQRGDLLVSIMRWLEYGLPLLDVFCFLPRMLLVAAWLESRTIKAHLGLDRGQGEKC